MWLTLVASLAVPNPVGPPGGGSGLARTTPKVAVDLVGRHTRPGERRGDLRRDLPRARPRRNPRRAPHHYPARPQHQAQRPGTAPSVSWARRQATPGAIVKTCGWRFSASSAAAFVGAGAVVAFDEDAAFDEHQRAQASSWWLGLMLRTGRVVVRRTTRISPWSSSGQGPPRFTTALTRSGDDGSPGRPPPSELSERAPAASRRADGIGHCQGGDQCEPHSGARVGSRSA